MMGGGVEGAVVHLTHKKNRFIDTKQMAADKIEKTWEPDKLCRISTETDNTSFSFKEREFKYEC